MKQVGEHPADHYNKVYLNILLVIRGWNNNNATCKFL